VLLGLNKYCTSIVCCHRSIGTLLVRAKVSVKAKFRCKYVSLYILMMCHHYPLYAIVYGFVLTVCNIYYPVGILVLRGQTTFSLLCWVRGKRVWLSLHRNSVR